MTRVLCSPWKGTFTLAPLVPLTMISLGGGMNVKKHALKTLIRTRFASKVIMFKETLEFKQTILLCY